MTQDRIIPFETEDGFCGNVIHVTGSQTPTRGPVLLVHGAGVRANIFRPPVDVTFVDYLLAHGYDVWLENWRASMDLSPCEWTLDRVARYDHPAAVKTVLRETGAKTLKAVIHCQGSTSFTMAAIAGLLPEVTTIVSNAVSLHTQVSKLSQLKLKFAIPPVAAMTRYLNPQWGLHAEGFVPKLIDKVVRLSHHECDNPVCLHSSFTYGTGHPTLWRHENLNEATHEWLKDEFGPVPLSFFKQMRRCVKAGHLVSAASLPDMPADFTAEPPKTTARFAFVAGLKNACFNWQGQQQSFDYFDQIRPNYHSLQLLAEYGHLDVFMGKNAAHDTFPILVSELDKPTDA